jgi:deoxyribodipyrimidine photo-lyase
VSAALHKRGIELSTHGGVSCTDVAAITTEDGEPFRLFTPFFRAWRAAPRRSTELRPRILMAPAFELRGKVPSHSQLKIDTEAKRIAELAEPGEEASRERLDAYMKRINTYEEARDRPDLDWTSRLSAAIHFGCVSPRALEDRLTARRSGARAQLRRQLARRDFFLHLAHHFPGTLRKGHERRLQGFRWRRNRGDLEAWKRGQTGLPLVDAGMRQLLSEGWIHNRVRMVAATFLTKHLLIDWREGEAHFMRHLIDGDEASNNGNWQWAASIGADPQAYFRAFNPVRHLTRFDPDGIYVRRWLPELAKFPQEFLAEPWKADIETQRECRCKIGVDYPMPIVDLIAAREEAVARFRSHLAHAG